VTLAVVIVSYNVRELLLRCLGSLPDDLEIIVVDNGSTDGSVAAVHAAYPRVQVLALTDNRGYGAANNLGVAATCADAILLLNPDTEVPSGGVEQMQQALSRAPAAGALGFRQVDQHGEWQLTVGPPPWLSLELVRKLIQGRLDHGAVRLRRWIERWLGSQPRPVPWVAGSCLLVRRAAYREVAGFDEKFFLFFEDIDLCLRLRRAGYDVLYEPAVTVLHHRGKSAATEPGPAERAYRQSQLYYWRKHRGTYVAFAVRLYQWLGHMRRTGGA